jgi:catechol 2,3-dioxygenase-like lactoylglutathione lyase family enzyme
MTAPMNLEAIPGLALRQTKESWEPIMFNHIMLGTNDVERSKQFYDQLLAVLDVPPGIENRNPEGKRRLFYLHPKGVFCVSEPLNGEPASSANGGTIGFTCTSEEQVCAFHDAAIAAGGISIEDPPGLRNPSFGGPTFLAYVRDPDGNKLCAVYREAAHNKG